MGFCDSLEYNIYVYDNYLAVAFVILVVQTQNRLDSMSRRGIILMHSNVTVLDAFYLVKY